MVKCCKWIAMMVFAPACAIYGQEQRRITNSVVESLYMAPQADQVDLRLDHKPLVREDKGMKTGRELRQGQTDSRAVRPKIQSLDSLGSRQEKADLQLRQDRAKVKREAAVDDSDSD